MKIIVLGAGMVGKAIAFDLSKNFEVTSADISKTALDKVAQYGVKIINADLSDFTVIAELVKEFDLVVSCVPGYMGYKTVNAIIEAKKPVVDISFMPEDFMTLNDMALKAGIPVIADCGVAPGMPNLILGYYNQLMKITDFFYMVGGLPKVRNYPFQYKAPFSPVDVLEEYTRPARYKENGKIVIKPAMSDTELFRFDRVGDLEGFNTDGLRSLLVTMEHISNMKEKTLRYPGHIDIIKVLNSSGFFSNEPMPLGKDQISPMEMTSKILFKEWKLETNEPEFTVMRIIIKGLLNGKDKTVTYDLYDEFDPLTEQWSMARTTGYTATAAVNLIAKGLFNKSGVFPLELVGENPECFTFVMEYLKERGVVYRLID
jgi:saccharopine dehydrogenase-like NADP-dependent oxidoreductase